MVSNYIRDVKPPFIQQNGHLQTIVPALFRRVKGLHYIRERIITPDGDFLDLDWASKNGKNLLIICHGLEGSSSKAYVRGMAKNFCEKSWSVVAWNYRGCSGEINQKIRFYHSGATEDLQTVIDHVNTDHHFDGIYLLGFSLGGNLVLKYLGEQDKRVSKSIVKALVFSVPTNLYDSCLKLSNGFNRLYSRRFLHLLKDKVLIKAKHFPQQFDLVKLKTINSLIDFDHHFTAPIHGFKGAIDYYQQSSAQQFLINIKVPTLIVNAINDPFLAPSCYPASMLKNQPLVDLLTPSAGGHCGFADREIASGYWSEALAWKYMNT